MKRSFSPQDIVVTTRSLFPFLYGLKDKEPGFAYKLIDADALLNLASFNFVNDPIPSLLVKGFSYPNAKRYSLLLRLGLAKGNIEAKRFLDELGAEGVDKDPLGIYELNQGKVYFFEMKEDVELHRLLRDEGIDAIDIGLEDLGVSEMIEERNYTIFANKFEQFSYIFSQIYYSI
jgi:hypothetical protein